MNELILLTLSGSDKPGVTAGITTILAKYDVEVLDIGQAVIHNTLSLGLLLKVPHEAESSPLLRDLLFKAHEMNMVPRFEPVTLEEYQSWVGAQGKSRHIITLLARRISAEHIAKVTEVAARYDLNIDNISRLSGRVSIDEVEEESSKACVEFSVRDMSADEAEVRETLLTLASELGVDIAFQRDDIYRRNRRLVVFDMDSTLIEAEVIDELAKEAGVGDQVSEITEAAMRGEIDFNESFKRRVALLEGLDESVLEGIAQRLKMTEGAEQLMSQLKRTGYKTAILSGGFTYFAKFLQKRLGFDYIHANELDIQDGKVTGKVVGTVVNGERKAELLREIAAKEGVSLEQTIAVGDGANDLPMLSIAGLGIAFRAKPLVRENAKQSISTLGLDGILYLIGFRDRDV
ncbi:MULTISPECIES: phosphoserine phosphatase SerB [unclassified Marinobacterium]|jgi:phosphoserine phosphatase|uniref:phosphoserine phosphatase SerB n=1 Tax=unclassified Marinobacterium TaxID=2644139 RepID=UPI001568AEE3|nr:MULTISPECIES: phosphoserine phosphatase SerB [unclassified Marinobacterium]NRP53662.1 Phosphoserine phosphatase [Marinobacterium sp. xm-v-242]NRP78160.1 Phosphoserine phosphatase [Marinobacterium sp. xm-m-383]NRQ02986.1 Phosphoserine phosphatase [Marinobacterium sp. xm-d-530]